MEISIKIKIKKLCLSLSFVYPNPYTQKITAIYLISIEVVILKYQMQPSAASQEKNLQFSQELIENLE